MNIKRFKEFWLNKTYSRLEAYLFTIFTVAWIILLPNMLRLSLTLPNRILNFMDWLMFG